MTFLSDLLWNCFLCWDRGNCDVPPTLDAALLCSSRADSVHPVPALLPATAVYT